MNLQDYSMKMTEQEYHDYPCWSHSMIARYAREGFSAIKTIHEKTKPTPSMEFGSLVDCMITRPADVEKEYFVVYKDIPKAEKEALDYLADREYPAETLNGYTFGELKEITDECGYQSRWGAETKYNHLSIYNDYYEAKVKGKKVVSYSDYEDAYKMAYAISNSENTKDLFKSGTQGNKEYIYQAKFKITYQTNFGPVEIKFMPDLIIIDNENRTIQLVDLKTSAQPGYDFSESFLKFRYDIEASLYTYAMQQIMNEHDFYSSYTLLPFLFADISRTDMVPVTYTYDCTSETQCQGLTYGSDKVYSYKNWDVLLNEILSYEASGAIVPNNISLAAPNDIIELLNIKR